MDSCIFCAQKHLGLADVYLQEARSGYRGRMTKCLGQLAAAEEESRAAYPELAALIRQARKHLEASPDDQMFHFEDIFDLVEQLVGRADPAERKRCEDDIEDIRQRKEDCPGCGKRRGEQLINIQVRQPPQPGTRGPRPNKVILLTALSDFDPSYSLVTVILDQLRAGARAGFEMVLVGMKNMTNMPDIAGVTFEPLLPVIPWREDHLDPALVEQLTTVVREYLWSQKPAIVLTHDFLFQSWYLSMAAALHAIGDSIDDIEWYHQLHSSVGPRPPPEVPQYRAQVPPGHRMVSINWANIPEQALYYQIDQDRFDVLPNIRDPEHFLGLSDRVIDLVDRLELFEQDIVAVFPTSRPWFGAKGIDKIIMVFHQLVHQHQRKAKFLIINANSGSGDAKSQLTQYRNYIAELQLGGHVFFTSDIYPELEVSGLPETDVRQLLDLSNVFLFPSVSEACGLVMLEAALTTNLLVLNEDLPVLKEFVRPEHALWIPWGSDLQPRDPKDLERIIPYAAGEIVQALDRDRVNLSRRQALKKASLGHLVSAMSTIWR